MRVWVESIFASKVLADASDDSLIVLTAAAPADLLGAWTAHATRMNHGFLWAPGDLAREHDGWTMIGHGAVEAIDAHGGARWDEVATRARPVFDRVVERIEPGTIVPPLRFFGGASFHPTTSEARDANSPWSRFGDASFVLPRWLYGVRQGEAFARFAFRKTELATPAVLLAEIRATEALATTKGDIGPPGATSPPEDDADPSWRTLVDDALDAIHRGTFQKVVVARRSRVARTISVPASLHRLQRQNPESTTFAFTRGPSTFLGASPERLIFVEGNRFRTEALAGTIARRDDDASAKSALLSSDKDRREHRIVVDGIAAALAPFASELTIGAAPHVRTLGRVHHLATPISGDLDRATHVLALVAALHPTPAVSGLPKVAAWEWIGDHEPFERGWYASPVGWFDALGDGTFAVAIRSAVVEDGRAFLFAGAGIVDGSEPDAEFRETELKQKTMLAALGASA